MDDYNNIEDIENNLEDRLNQGLIPNSELHQINDISEVYKSIYNIITQDSGLGTGFFIKINKSIKSFYYLITNEHVISKEMIFNHETIEVIYDNQKKNIKIKLNKNKRFIQDYLYLGIDAVIIQILFEDNIPESYFLLPHTQYINGYKQFEKEQIYIPQYALGGNLQCAFGSIKQINLYKNEITHLVTTLSGSSGSPILIKGTITVFGIHKQANLKQKENYGNLLGPIIDALKNTNSKVEIQKLENGTYEGELINNIKEGNGKFIYNDGEFYIGQFKNNKFNGKGVIFYDKNKIKYEGDFLNDKYNGLGTLFYKNGEFYIGQFKDGKKNGKGTEYYKDKKIKYKGEFSNDLYNGNGKFVYQNGNYYIGQWLEGKKHFKGTVYNNLNKILYEGDFLFDEVIGKGKLYYKDGSYYIGELLYGLKEGNGVVYYENNSIKCDGFFVKDKMEGEGTLYFEDGSYYIGKFKDGKRDGYGKCFDKDNNLIYEGGFEKDLYEGYGQLALSDGFIYYGEFKNGHKYGNGVIVNTNGEVELEGKFSGEDNESNINDIRIEELKRNNKNINNISEEKPGIRVIDFKGKLTNGIEKGKKANLHFEINNKKEQSEPMEGVFNIEVENQSSIKVKGILNNSKFTGKAEIFDEEKKLIYEGDYVNSKKEGIGRQIYESGNYYIGEFHNDEENGNGMVFDKDDNILYEGEFKNGKKNGKGKLYFNGLLIYEGDFVDNKSEGRGKALFKDGNYYIGEMRNNELNGQGKIIDANNMILYEGSFMNGKPNGNGKAILDNLCYYIGEFKDGNMHGKGKEYDLNKKLIYEGEFKNNKYNGEGTRHYENGNCYIGKFIDGIEKGDGILFDKNMKIIYEGEFDGIDGIKQNAKKIVYNIKNIFNWNK